MISAMRATGEISSPFGVSHLVCQQPRLIGLAFFPSAPCLRGFASHRIRGLSLPMQQGRRLDRDGRSAQLHAAATAHCRTNGLSARILACLIRLLLLFSQSETRFRPADEAVEVDEGDDGIALIVPRGFGHSLNDCDVLCSAAGDELMDVHAANEAARERYQAQLGSCAFALPFTRCRRCD